MTPRERRVGQTHCLLEAPAPCPPKTKGTELLGSGLPVQDWTPRKVGSQSSRRCGTELSTHPERRARGRRVTGSCSTFPQRHWGQPNYDLGRRGRGSPSLRVCRAGGPVFLSSTFWTITMKPSPRRQVGQH